MFETRKMKKTTVCRTCVAVAVGLEQRADQEHRRPGRPDQAGQDAPRAPRNAVLTAGRATRSPLSCSPPEIT